MRAAILGYTIRPDGEEYAYSGRARKKKQQILYLMVKTPAGKFVISTHCANVVNEMSSLDKKFEELRRKANIPMPSWDRLRNEALSILVR